MIPIVRPCKTAPLVPVQIPSRNLCFALTLKSPDPFQPLQRITIIHERIVPEAYRVFLDGKELVGFETLSLARSYIEKEWV